MAFDSVSTPEITYDKFKKKYEKCKLNMQFAQNRVEECQKMEESLELGEKENPIASECNKATAH